MGAGQAAAVRFGPDQAPPGAAALLPVDRALTLVEGLLSWPPGAVVRREAELFDTLRAVRAALLADRSGFLNASFDEEDHQ
jgi:hypothetical protein